MIGSGVGPATFAVQTSASFGAGPTGFAEQQGARGAQLAAESVHGARSVIRQASIELTGSPPPPESLQRGVGQIQDAAIAAVRETASSQGRPGGLVNIQA